MGTDFLICQYEELRSEALGGTGRGIGLTMFLRSGMKSWIEAWSNHALQSPRQSTEALASGDSASRREITLILAGMAFEHCRGGQL